MILPSKHVNISDSLLSAGGDILKNLRGTITVSRLWDQTNELSSIATYERFILALDMLYILGVIDFNNGLIIKREN